MAGAIASLWVCNIFDACNIVCRLSEKRRQWLHWDLHCCCCLYATAEPEMTVPAVMTPGLVFFAHALFWPLSVARWSALRTQHFTIVPSNVECLADYISPNADIRKTEIHFNSPSPELLLRVPIETPKSDSAIVITMGFDGYYLTKHYRMRFTLHDSSSFNRFELMPEILYTSAAPCYFTGVESEHDTRVSEGTQPPSTFKFTLLPSIRLAHCETAQEGGYVNVAKFRDQLNPSAPWYLEFTTKYRNEVHSIYYISIEFI